MFTTVLTNGTRIEQALDNGTHIESQPCGRCGIFCEPKGRVTFNVTSWNGHHYQQQYHLDCAFSYYGYRGD